VAQFTRAATMIITASSWSSGDVTAPNVRALRNVNRHSSANSKLQNTENRRGNRDTNHAITTTFDVTVQLRKVTLQKEDSKLQP
jgi:hypothetical protein